MLRALDRLTDTIAYPHRFMGVTGDPDESEPFHGPSRPYQLPPPRTFTPTGPANAVYNVTVRNRWHASGSHPTASTFWIRGGGDYVTIVISQYIDNKTGRFIYTFSAGGLNYIHTDGAPADASNPVLSTDALTKAWKIRQVYTSSSENITSVEFASGSAGGLYFKVNP